MSTARFLVGDVFDRMAELPDGSVDLVLTSPPFLALRSYLPADHPDKGREIGSEATPAEFVDTLLRLTAEWRRLLAPHGSLCVELGDTYSGSSAQGTDQQGNDRYPNGRGMESLSIVKNGPGWPLAKSLALVPEAYRFALAYGHNPHTGQPSPAGQWRVRNVIRWVRPNPPVGALGDKFRPATSEMVVAAVASDRFFDLDAVRTTPTADPATYSGNGYTKGNPSGDGEDNAMPGNPAGAPPLDWWKLSPGGYAGAHYAVWPPELCVKPIKAMCPERVCRECGQPSRRIVEVTHDVEEQRRRRSVGATKGKLVHDRGDLGASMFLTTTTTTIGWTDCGHNNWRPGLVLDPFAGSGTTLAVATGHGRDAIGIDIDERNADLARERVGELFLTVEAA